MYTRGWAVWLPAQTTRTEVDIALYSAPCIRLNYDIYTLTAVDCCYYNGFVLLIVVAFICSALWNNLLLIPFSYYSFTLLHSNNFSLCSFVSPLFPIRRYSNLEFGCSSLTVFLSCIVCPVSWFQCFHGFFIQWTRLLLAICCSSSHYIAEQANSSFPLHTWHISAFHIFVDVLILSMNKLYSFSTVFSDFHRIFYLFLHYFFYFSWFHREHTLCNTETFWSINAF